MKKSPVIALRRLPVGVGRRLLGAAGGMRLPFFFRLGEADIVTAIRKDSLPESTGWRLGLRAEHVELTTPGKPHIPATVDFVERLGEQSWVHVRLADGREIVASEAGVSAHQPGDRVGVRLDGAKAHLFDAAGTAWHPEPA